MILTLSLIGSAAGYFSLAIHFRSATNIEISVGVPHIEYEQDWPIEPLLLIVRWR
jgi:hypothetical protein